MKTYLLKLWNSFLAPAFMILAISAIIGPAVAGYALKWDIRAVGDIGISAYAIHSIIHFIFQVVSAEVNNWRMTREVKARPRDWKDIKVAIIVAGYREDAYMFEQCLRSIKDSNYENISNIICIIDGKDEEDMYMADIYKTVFGTDIKTLDFLLCEVDEERKVVELNNIQLDKYMCILQPHAGKRDALYTGFKLIMKDPTIQAVITTDSDTIVELAAVKELVYPLRHDDIGAVAGQVLIWNTDSLLTFIVSFRYWMSFNLERGCESLWKTVLCIAGPMGCYKIGLIKDVLDEWINQKFLGNKCTYGDDRHLTNRILMRGKKVIYTPFAVGHTDTPYNYERYLVQQTRWSKSYFREFFFTIGCIHKHFIWMGYELIYHFTYFFLLMYWMIHLFYFANIKTQVIAVFVTTIMSLFRSLYGAIKTRDPKFILFNLYSYVYFFIIIPAKIMALLTIWDISWGTRGQSSSNGIISLIFNKVHTYFTLLLWFCFSAGGFLYSLYYSRDFKISNDMYRIGFIGICAYIFYMFINIASFYILHFTKISHTRLLKDIKRAKENISETPNIVILQN